jgi:hypothetical protein
MAVTKPYKFIRFGAMDVTKPYKFIGLRAMAITKPYKFIGLGGVEGRTYTGVSRWYLMHTPANHLYPPSLPAPNRTIASI